MNRTAVSLLHVGLMASAICSAQSVFAQSIKISDFEVTKIDSQKTKLVVTAAAKDIAIGSFFIRIDQRPPGTILPGFFSHQDFEFLNGGTPQKPSPMLMDNGPLDEDPRAGVFGYTFNTANWPQGRYMILAGAHNRPAAGAYVQGSRGMKIEVGDVKPIEISNIPSVEHRDVYMKDGIYACFPTLSIFPDGRLATTFGTKTVRSHIDDAGGSKSLISSDGGKTWSSASDPIVDRKEFTKDGSLATAEAVGWVYVDASKEKELRDQHKILMSVRPGVVAYLGGAQARTSADGGKTWRKTEVPVPEDCLGLMNHHKQATELVTSKGVRLVAVYGKRLQPDQPNSQGKDEVYIIRSEDDGKNWKCSAMYPDGLPDPSVGYNETAIEEASDGTIIAMMRSTAQDYLWQAESRDGGLTWSKAKKTAIWGFPPDMLRLSDGRLLCAYGYRRNPMGVRAALSRDNGKTWDVQHELIVRSDGFGSAGDLGYPLIHELPDHSIFMIYYHTTDGFTTHIATSHFQLPAQ